MKRMQHVALAVGLTATLAACGGSDDSPAPPPGDGLTQQQREDRDASASVAGLLAFARTVVAALTSEASEPRAIDGVTPPVTDSDEPAVL